MEINFDSDSDEEEQSALDYARLHGLCVDYTTEQLPCSNVDAPSSDILDRDFDSPSDASTTRALAGLTKERLTLNRDAALLLKAIHSLQEAPADAIVVPDKRKWILDMKQELPVLRTDYELDMLEFGDAAMPELSNLRIPCEAIDEEKDEGFEWPAKFLNFPAQCDERARAEKLAVSREVLLYLQGAVRDEYSTEDYERVIAGSSSYNLHKTIRPLTPPLLPLSPPLTPYIPSSPANRLPLTSDSNDSVTAEAKALEQQLMAADSLARKESDSSDSMLLDITQPPQFSPLTENSALPILKRRADDMKVEGPLTPPMFSTSPMKKLKSVSFADILHDYIPNEPWRRDDGNGDDDNASMESDEFFRAIEPLADQAKRKAENEQLSGPDTTARVDIPDVDFTLPVAPWDEHSRRKSDNHPSRITELEAQAKFILKVKREYLRSASSWPGVSALERGLHWSIFMTKVSTVNLEETLHGESEANKILKEATAGEIATSSSQVWKREGLRILDDDEDEDDLEPDEEQGEGGNIESLIRKRKLELDEEFAEKHSRQKTAQLDMWRPMPQPRKGQESNHWNERSVTNTSNGLNYHNSRGHGRGSRHEFQAPKNTSNDLMFGGFSASTALHKFMATRGKPPEPTNTSVSDKIPTDGMSDARRQKMPVRPSEPSQTDWGQKGHHDRRLPPKEPSLMPAIPRDLSPCSFIVSSMFLQQRSLLKQVEQLYPGADIIYRDYNLPHSPCEEADFLLSPSTGLMFTTIQQVKQRALPGQPDRSPIKELMSTLQLRYERLIVIVSEGLNREMEELGSSRPDDPHDKEALALFEDFAAKLEGEVLVKYIRGGEQALARSTVVEMAKYGLPHGSADIGDIRPLAVETSWEIFLRRAGLNPFAAQVIVASLKQPFDMQLSPSSTSSSHRRSTSVSVFGLPAFLVLGEQERIRCCQALMGGSRILKRVSRVLDRDWVSAANGFRM